MKEQSKTSERELSAEEIDNLSDGEFKPNSGLNSGNHNAHRTD